ncbi:MAG: DUF421 domain-containing protein [Candidatus Tectomicrobia bacterium]|uniref:DUF421 domain-containing protein n=1 Tax=Tectimicrobiota bacterium TaxID=2528274 RepID=A0A932I0H6_UNCTE|nr:DUF421 domain-containing protein [Candidatus Tectomicrobia bacterium]
MEPVLRATAIYLVLMILFRVMGKRSLAQITLFDFVLLLIIGEATQNALLSDDYSVTNGVLVIITLLMVDLGFSLWKEYSPRMEKAAEGTPLVLVEDGKPLDDRIQKERVNNEDIIEAARHQYGLWKMSQIRMAILEKNGGITIIPMELPYVTETIRRELDARLGRS